MNASQSTSASQNMIRNQSFPPPCLIRCHLNLDGNQPIQLVSRGEVTLSDPGLEKLEKQTALIHQLTENIRRLVPILDNLEDQLANCKRCFLIAKDIMGVYDT